MCEVSSYWGPRILTRHLFCIPPMCEVSYCPFRADGGPSSRHRQASRLRLRHLVLVAPQVVCDCPYPSPCHGANPPMIKPTDVAVAAAIARTKPSVACRVFLSEGPQLLGDTGQGPSHVARLAIHPVLYIMRTTTPAVLPTRTEMRIYGPCPWSVVKQKGHHVSGHSTAETLGRG